MGQSPSWAANRSLASQEIPRILWSQKVHYRIQKLLLPVPTLSHIKLAHAFTFHFLKIENSIIFPDNPRSLSLTPPYQHPVRISPVSHTCHMSRPSHFSLFHYRIIFGEEHRSWSYTLCSLLLSPVTAAWRIIRSRMEKRLPGIDGTCEYIE